MQLGVLDGGDVLFLERLSAPGAVINYSRIAGRLPLYVSSSRQVLLAFGGRELWERILAGPLCRYSAHTLTSRLRCARVERYGMSPTNVQIQEVPPPRSRDTILNPIQGSGRARTG